MRPVLAIAGVLVLLIVGCGGSESTAGEGPTEEQAMRILKAAGYDDLYGIGGVDLMGSAGLRVYTGMPQEELVATDVCNILGERWSVIRVYDKGGDEIESEQCPGL